MKKLNYLALALSLVLLGACGDDEFGANSDAPIGPGVGTGGSLAAFSIIGDYLYSVEGFTIKTFDISAGTEIEAKDAVWVPSQAQTIFGYQGFLFIGSNTDMYVYSLSRPDRPSLVATHSRLVTACDPVVVKDDIAYTTINVQSCRGGVGQEVLDVLDVSDPERPFHFNSVDVSNPFGLGVNSTHLFLCRGVQGMSIWTTEALIGSQSPAPITTTMPSFNGQNLDPIDVIPLGEELLLCTGRGGLYLLDVVDPMNIQVISALSTGA